MPAIFVIRTDFGPTVGLGHLTRCAALAAELQRCGAVVTFACAGDAQVETAFRQNVAPSEVPYGFHRIDAEPGSAEDAAATRALGPDADWLIFDGYQFSAHYIESIRTKNGADDAKRPRIACIDDRTIDYPCDLTIRGHLHFSSRPADAPHTVAGPLFALLRRQIRDARGLRDAHASVRIPHRMVLVTFGGSDPSCETERVFDVLELCKHERLRIVACVGSQNARHGAIAALAKRLAARHDLQVEVGVDLAKFLPDADVAISAAGTTALELACVGVPSLLRAVAENQRPVAAAAASLGTAWAIPEDASAAHVSKMLDDLLEQSHVRERMALRGKDIVDGRGAERVADVLLSWK